MKGNQNNMLMLLSPSAAQQIKELEGGIPPTLHNGPLPVLSLRVIPESMTFWTLIEPQFNTEYRDRGNRNLAFLYWSEPS
jgi:hypothetical protein